MIHIRPLWFGAPILIIYAAYLAFILILPVWLMLIYMGAIKGSIILTSIVLFTTWTTFPNFIELLKHILNVFPEAFDETQLQKQKNPRP